MTKVTALLFGDDKESLARVKDAVILTLKREFLPRNLKAGDVYWSEKHSNYTCYIEVEVGKELGSIPIPEGFYDSKPTIVLKLKEAKEDANNR